MVLKQGASVPKREKENEGNEKEAKRSKKGNAEKTICGLQDVFEQKRKEKEREREEAFFARLRKCPDTWDDIEALLDEKMIGNNQEKDKEKEKQIHGNKWNLLNHAEASELLIDNGICERLVAGLSKDVLQKMCSCYAHQEPGAALPSRFMSELKPAFRIPRSTALSIRSTTS